MAAAGVVLSSHISTYCKSQYLLLLVNITGENETVRSGNVTGQGEEVAVS